jgi:hypothetical protein
MTAPDVLGLDADKAECRLVKAGFPGIGILVSGRRREGRPRVIRQKADGDTVVLVVSYFKELDNSQ